MRSTAVSFFWECWHKLLSLTQKHVFSSIIAIVFTVQIRIDKSVCHDRDCIVYVSIQSCAQEVIRLVHFGSEPLQ